MAAVAPLRGDTLILGALPLEVEMLQSELSGTQIYSIGGRTFYQGMLEGERVVLTESGIGKVNAALTTQMAIDRFPVDRVIFTGVAGGIDPELKVGDMVVATWLAHHDYGVVTAKGFKWSPVPGSGKVKLRRFPVDAGLQRIALKVAKSLDWPPIPRGVAPGVAGRKPVVVARPIVTGDQFIASEVKRVWIFRTFRAGAVEMEGAAVAQVCHANRVPCLVLRSLSDLANEHAHLDFDRFAPYAARNSARFVRAILRTLTEGP